VIFRRRRPILVGSLIMVLVAAVFALPVFGELGNANDFDDPAAEAVMARDAVVDATGTYAAPQLVALVRLGADADSEAGRRRIAEVARAMRHPGVAAVVAYEPGGDQRLVSKDRRSTYLLATYREDDRGATDAIQARLRALDFVTLGGGAIAAPQVGDQVSADILRAEIIAFPLLFLLSLIVFRSAVSALLPLAVGGTTILLSFLAIRAINAHVNPMSIYALNLINGLGLGLAIDYSLFMVSRFREELEGDGDRSRALIATVRTAGRTVLFSAFTVAAALAAMLVFPLRFLYSMGAGGMLVALSAAFVSLTLLPALLAVLGPRVNALGLRRWRVAMHRDAAHVRAGPWYRLSRGVMRRPGPVAAFASSSPASTHPCCRTTRARRSSTRRCAASSRPGRRRPCSWSRAAASAGARRRRTMGAGWRRSTAWPA
jgi:uncharacterized membrane protein YdfJ with MMPL/SSD domain